MELLLEGTRVIDWTIWQAGPYASGMLADLGAEVIHVEELRRGDPQRGLHTFAGISLTVPGGRTIQFEEYNRGKKSLAIDLKKPEGQEVIKRLVKHSDIFVTNYLPGAAKRLGLDYDSLSQLNPKIIYARASSYGPEGPDANQGGLDLPGAARSGMMMNSGEFEQRPIHVATGIGDRSVSHCLVLGILAGLLGREKFKRGQLVTVSLLGALINLQGCGIVAAANMGSEFKPHKRACPGNALWNWYKCKDGRWIILAMLSHERYWTVFCQAVGMPQLAEDPRFKNEDTARKNVEQMVAVLDGIFITKAYHEWEAILKKHDVVFTACNSIMDVLSDPQVLANKYIYDWEHPVLGRIKNVGPPVDLNLTPLYPRGPAPEYGQHTEEVLLEVGGYTWDEICSLRDKDVI